MSSSSARKPAEGRAPAPSVLDRRELLLGVAALFSSLLAGACGGEVPAPASAARARKKPGDRVDPVELFPADLDLVLRVDLGRMRSQLGPAADTLATRLEQEQGSEFGEELVTLALRRAKIVWVGVRLADIEAGDRVLVIEGDVEDLKPNPAIYRPVDPPLRDDIRTFDRAGPLRRSATARIHAFGGRAIAFVSPIEVDSFERVVRNGPDEHRRDPSAEGLVSADLRARRLSPSLERRFPAMASIIGGVDRTRANAAMVGESLRVDAEISATSEASAKKAHGLLNALREGGQGSRYAALFKDVSIERVERAVRVRWSFSPEILRALIEGTMAAPDHVQREP